jgi:hypothetical protein
MGRLDMIIYNLEEIILISMFGFTGVIAGIILIVVGGLFVFFFPSASEYQPEQFGIVIVIAGFVMIILGAIMVFV